MSKKRKMDIDDKKKAFIMGIAFMMLFIILYFTFIHRLVGGSEAPWQVVDSILLGGTALSFVLAFLIAWLRRGDDHTVDAEQPGTKRKFDD